MIAEAHINTSLEPDEAFIPRAKYEALRETLELAIGVAISRAQFARGEGVPHKEVMRQARERLMR